MTTNRVPQEVLGAISRLLENQDLYHYVETFSETMIDPAEYREYCKVCEAPDQEHKPDCMFYPIWMAI